MRHYLIAFIQLIWISIPVNVNGQVRTHNSWHDPVILCSAQDFTWDKLHPATELMSTDLESCIKPFENLNCVWFRFKTAKSSLLSFTIKPINPQSDIDFAVYSSVQGAPGELLRCMSTGLNLDTDREAQKQCFGSTGLLQNETDVIEEPGCGLNHNNFLRSIDVSKGQELLLQITNYKSGDGFSFHWMDNSILSSELCFEEKLTTELVRIKASPNPAKDIIHCTITSSMEGKASIRLFNSSGNIVDQDETNLIAGINDYSTSTKNFSPGTYYMNLLVGELKSETIKLEIVK